MTHPVQTVSAVPTLPPRPADGHKGTFGTVLVVAGSKGMSGAAILSGSAAVRGGAGLVRVATAADVQEVVSGGNPCYLTGTLDEVAKLAEKATVAAVGPGLGQNDATRHAVREVLARPLPVLLDADALNVLHPDQLRGRAFPTLLTPHPGEFARLTGLSTEDVQADREGMAVRFAAGWGVVLVLKGRSTLVTDGGRVYRNTTGNPGMGTGGTGDVLTGLIAALVAQKLPPFDAAVLGVWAHGRAGDLAAEAVGQTALCATDLLAHLPAALKEAEQR